jgi:hypothetical protein
MKVKTKIINHLGNKLFDKHLDRIYNKEATKIIWLELSLVVKALFVRKVKAEKRGKGLMECGPSSTQKFIQINIVKCFCK